MPGEDFIKFLLGGFFLLFFVWLLTGGPAKYEATYGLDEDPFLKLPNPLDTGETYGPEDVQKQDLGL